MSQPQHSTVRKTLGTAAARACSGREREACSAVHAQPQRRFQPQVAAAAATTAAAAVFRAGQGRLPAAWSSGVRGGRGLVAGRRSPGWLLRRMRLTVRVCSGGGALWARCSGTGCEADRKADAANGAAPQDVSHLT